MQDQSNTNNLIQLPKQRDLTSPETSNKIKYLMSTYLAGRFSTGAMGHLWDTYRVFWVAVRGQIDTVSSAIFYCWQYELMPPFMTRQKPVYRHINSSLLRSADVGARCLSSDFIFQLISTEDHLRSRCSYIFLWGWQIKHDQQGKFMD